MKKLLMYFGVLTCVIAWFSSCEQSNIENLRVANENSEMKIFKYKGKTYSSAYQYIGDKVIFSNEAVQRIQDELANKPSLATLVDASGSVEYFDNYEELQKSTERNWKPMPTVTRTPTIYAKLVTHLHINVKFRGGGQTYVFYDPGEPIQIWINDMSRIALDNNGLNQKLSSLQLLMDVYHFGNYAAFITLWDQKEFKGNSITFDVRNGDPSRKVRDLSEWTRGSFLSNLDWNDAAQSLAVGWR